MIIATLIAADRLTQDNLWDVFDALDEIGVQAHGGGFREPGAIDLMIVEREDCDLSSWADPPKLPGPEQLRAVQRRWIADIKAAISGAVPRVDVVVQPEKHRFKRLLLADMDSTMIEVECIDELADYAGVKSQVAAVTERAMRGEIGFEAALDARVALLAGLEEAAIDRCREERVRFTPGAKALVRTMGARGATCILVSGGFTRFAGPVAAEIGFDRVIANELEIESGRLTGRVKRPIVGAEAKQAALLAAAEELEIPLAATMAVGDGANDIPMIEAAGLGLAYHAKLALKAAADAVVDHNDLTALLYAQGIPRSEWVLD
jgi:phosphoserine phosphatase